MFTTLLLLLVVINLETSQACNGYKLKVDKIEHCVDDPVIKIENGDAQFDNDCNLILTGCIITKGFKTSKGSYRLDKPPMPPISGSMDFCAAAADVKSPQLDQMAKVYNMPRNCPIPQAKVCSTPDQKISLKKFKNMLGAAAGTSKFHIESDYDTGRSCFDFTITITKDNAFGK